MDLKIEEKKLCELRFENENAQAEYNRQLERDSVRQDGSPRQDALHEKFLKDSHDRAYKTNADLVVQENLVAKWSEK